MRRSFWPRLGRCLKTLALALLACPASIGHAQDGDAPGLQLVQHEVTVQGQVRPYFVHMPPKPTDPAPVVMMFHGGGGRPEGFGRRSGMNEVADRNGFVVVYPAGTKQPSGRGGTWDVGGAQSVVSSDDVAYVKAILQDLRAKLPIDENRIYAAGVSMGGVMSYRLACEMSDTFAAIVPVSATMVEPACHPTRPVAVLHIHGTADDRIPIAGGSGTQTARGRAWPAPQAGITAWSQFDGCAAAPAHGAEGGADCETYEHCRASVEFCVRPGMRHGWPEDVAPEIWAFFAEHPKVATP